MVLILSQIIAIQQQILFHFAIWIMNPGQFPNQQNMAHTHFLTEAALTSCGFQQATRSSTPRQIQNIHPHGGTAMRDALLYGNDLMMRLHATLQRQATANNWFFMHILITDGHDTHSQASIQKTHQALRKLRSDMNVRDLKIVILGVDIESSYARALKRLVSKAGHHGEYHDITHTDITKMFHRIREDAGMLKRRMINPNLSAMNNMGKMPSKNMIQVQIQNYAVLFTLDISGSMNGHKWEVTRHATVDFIRYLGSNDLVSAIVFNDTPHLVLHWNTRQAQVQMAQRGNVQPFQQVMQNTAYLDPKEFGPGQQPWKGGFMQQPLRDGATYTIKYTSSQDDCCCC